MISRAIRKTFDFPEGQGTRFYEFERIDDLKEFKNLYREKLDEAGAQLEPQQLDLLVTEANQAFDFNSAILRELSIEANSSNHGGEAQPRQRRKPQPQSQATQSEGAEEVAAHAVGKSSKSLIRENLFLMLMVMLMVIALSYSWFAKL